MKYKILLMGNNTTAISDFFSHLDENIEPMTTSQRYEDVLRHIQYFQPDALCYCAASELEEYISKTRSVKMRLRQEQIPFVLFGADEDITDFIGVVGPDDLILRKPMKVSSIEERMIKFIEETRHIKKLREEKERQREEEKRKREEEERRQFEEEILNWGTKHILVIDDDSAMLKTIKEQLHGEYEVATALSGKIAMKFLEKKTTDLILLDYEMPIETGPMVLEKLRENPATKDIPVIFLTGVTEMDKIKQVLKMKPQGYLLKPIEHDKLMKAIKQALQGD